jgi:putative spermidine/putrescine transport system substrate-binding protein
MSRKQTRRNFLANAVAAGIATGAGALLPGASLIRNVRAQTAGRVVVSGWGGAIQDAMRKAYFAPFTQATGIEVVEQTYGAQGLARAKAQLGEGAAQVDLLDGPPFWTVIGRDQSLLDKIELPNLNRSHFMSGAIDEYGFGYGTVSWGIAYNKQTVGAPRNWKDFWDTKTFKARRAMFGPLVARHLEYALMAAGVAPKEVYPLNDAKIDRAFGKLAEIKPAMNVWYQTGAQCEQLLLDKQIDMAEFFNGRVYYHQDQGAPLEFVWNEAVMNLLVFVLAKGAPNRDNALKLLSFIARPEPQAEFAKLIYYGPTNIQALDLIKDKKILERLPTHPANFAKQIVLDGRWWGENLGKLSARWSQLISA